MDIRYNIREFVITGVSMYGDVVFSDSDNFFELGYVDSMFALRLVTYIEEQYQITVNNEDLDIENFNSIDNIVRFINAKAQGGL